MNWIAGQYNVHRASTKNRLINLTIEWTSKGYRAHINGTSVGCWQSLDKAKFAAETQAKSFLYEAAKELGATDFLWEDQCPKT